MHRQNSDVPTGHQKGFWMPVKIGIRCNIVVAMLMVGLFCGQRSLAQSPGAPEPKHYA